jgi:hypothetical protein
MKPLNKAATRTKRAGPRSKTVTKSRNGVEKSGAANAAKLYQDNKRQRTLSQISTQYNKKITDLSGSSSICQTVGKSRIDLTTSYKVLSNPLTPDKGEESDDSSSSVGSDIPAVITPEIRKKRAQKLRNQDTAALSPTVGPLSRGSSQAAASRTPEFQSIHQEHTTYHSLANCHPPSPLFFRKSSQANEDIAGDMGVIKKLANREGNAHQVSVSGTEYTRSRRPTLATKDNTPASSSTSGSSSPTSTKSNLSPLMTPDTNISSELTPFTIKSPVQPSPTTVTTTTTTIEIPDKVYEIKSILDAGHRILPSSRKSTRVYLIDWAGNYLPTWEPEDNVSASSVTAYTARVKSCKEFRATH